MDVLWEDLAKDLLVVFVPNIVIWYFVFVRPWWKDRQARKYILYDREGSIADTYGRVTVFRMQTHSQLERVKFMIEHVYDDPDPDRFMLTKDKRDLLRLRLKGLPVHFEEGVTYETL